MKNVKNGFDRHIRLAYWLNGIAIRRGDYANHPKGEGSGEKARIFSIAPNSIL